MHDEVVHPRLLVDAWPFHLELCVAFAARRDAPFSPHVCHTCIVHTSRHALPIALQALRGSRSQ
jgi:hypothetical protein